MVYQLWFRSGLGNDLKEKESGEAATYRDDGREEEGGYRTSIRSYIRLAVFVRYYRHCSRGYTIYSSSFWCIGKLLQAALPKT